MINCQQKNTSGEEFSFINNQKTSEGYLYQMKMKQCI